MVKRLIFAAVGVVGVVLIGLAIASATVWRADDVLRASASAAEPIVVADPGVLEMAGDPVTITATVPEGGRVVLAVGRDTDVSGWVGSDVHERVSGLAGWHALALVAPEPTAPASPSPEASAPATPTAAPSPEPSASAGAAADAGSDEAARDAAAPPDAADSDMWVAQAQGTGSATLTWQAQPGRWSLLVVGTTSTGAGAPPTVEMAWPRTVTTPYLVPGSVAGGVLLLAGLWLLWRDLRRARHGDEWTPVLTEPVPVVGGSAGGSPALTRRQMREIQALAAAAQRRRSAPPTGEVMVAPEALAQDEQSAHRGSPAHDEPAVPGVSAARGEPAVPGVAAAQDEPPRPPAAAALAGDTVTSPVSVSRRALRAAAAAAAAAAGRASGPTTPPSEAPPATGRAAEHVPSGGEHPPSEPAPKDGPSVPRWASHVADRPTRAPGRPSGPPEWSEAPSAGGRGRTAPADASRSSAADRARTSRSSSAAPARTGPDAGGGQPSWLPGGEWRRGRAARTAWPPVAAPGSAPGEGSEAPVGTDTGGADAQRTEASRADAWRRAWGLPPSDAEEDR